LLTTAGRLAGRLADAPVLARRIEEQEQRLGLAAAPSLLTTAELRILTYLPTHLSFREIGGRLHVSSNTVKSQAHAVYRKLDASCRSHAVARAVELGLLDA
jgi:LuxR family maltose regulon positive regulatory protein